MGRGRVRGKTVRIKFAACHLAFPKIFIVYINVYWIRG